MTRPAYHSVLPETTHDELARQHFVQSLATYLDRTMSPHLKRIYETEIKPDFEGEYNRPPRDRYEIRPLMEANPYYHWFSAVKRTAQEMLWESVGSSVDRQWPDLSAKIASESPKLGSLTLSPALVIPRYHTAIDIHCMPGGYGGQNEDVRGAAVYDRGTYVYGRGWLGDLNDDLGESAIHGYLKANYPDFTPYRILDLGCAVGHSTLPYVSAYPAAEVYGVDLSAAMLRYGHARAEALGKRVHFVQDNAESTRFPAGSFDLIVSHILFHEIPVFAIRNVLKECYRLLSPGGMMVHVEAPLYRHMDAYTAFLYDWQTANNNEPFWSAMRDLDLVAEAREANFDRITETFIPSYLHVLKRGNREGLGSRGTWLALAAIKEENEREI